MTYAVKKKNNIVENLYLESWVKVDHEVDVAAIETPISCTKDYAREVQKIGSSSPNRLHQFNAQYAQTLLRNLCRRILKISSFLI